MSKEGKKRKKKDATGGTAGTGKEEKREKWRSLPSSTGRKENPFFNSGEKSRGTVHESEDRFRREQDGRVMPAD